MKHNCYCIEFSDAHNNYINSSSSYKKNRTPKISLGQIARIVEYNSSETDCGTHVWRNKGLMFAFRH